MTALRSQDWTRGGGHYTNFTIPWFFSTFQNYRNIHYLMNITFIFDRCHCSWAAVTPVKYECDSKDLTGIFAKAGKSLTNKNGALVTPTLESLVWFISRTCITPVPSCQPSKCQTISYKFMADFELRMINISSFKTLQKTWQNMCYQQFPCWWPSTARYFTKSADTVITNLGPIHPQDWHLKGPTRSTVVQRLPTWIYPREQAMKIGCTRIKFLYIP